MAQLERSLRRARSMGYTSERELLALLVRQGCPLSEEKTAVRHLVGRSIVQSLREVEMEQGRWYTLPMTVYKVVRWPELADWIRDAQVRLVQARLESGS